MQMINFRPVGPLCRVRWTDDETGAGRTAWFASSVRAHQFLASVGRAASDDEPVHPLFDNRPMRWVLPAAFVAGLAVWAGVLWAVAS